MLVLGSLSFITPTEQPVKTNQWTPWANGMCQPKYIYIYIYIYILKKDGRGSCSLGTKRKHTALTEKGWPVVVQYEGLVFVFLCKNVLLWCALESRCALINTTLVYTDNNNTPDHLGEGVPTVGAGVRFLSGVDDLVERQAPLLGEALPTHRAGVRLLSSVDSHMDL